MEKIDNMSAIERVIRYSTLIWEIGLTLMQLRRAKLMINTIGIISNPQSGYIDEIMTSLERRKLELNNACKLLLLPLLQGKDFGHIKLDRFFFGQTEIKDGYAVYELVVGYDSLGLPIRNGQRYVLFLCPYYHPILGKFEEGGLYNFEIVKGFLNEVTPASKKYRRRIRSIFDSMHDTIANALIYTRIR